MGGSKRIGRGDRLVGLSSSEEERMRANPFAGTIEPKTMAAGKSSIASRMASATFGGPDLKTVYVGTLMGTAIPYFRSPAAGLPMVHWQTQ